MFYYTTISCQNSSRHPAPDCRISVPETVWKNSPRVYNHANYFRSTMKNVLNILAILLMFTGGIFFLQGINVLPGSFMTGDPQWAINGGTMIAVALGLGYLANRRR